MLLRARIVLPVSRPPIENGLVHVSGGRIRFVGSAREFQRPAQEEVVDLGEVILLPGLVNAHCHLDYTDFAGKIPPTRFFTDWIKSIVSLKATTTYSEYAASWLAGARMLLQTGTTTVADIEAVPELLPDAWNATPMRVYSFLEMTGLKSQRLPRDILDEALRHIDALPTVAQKNLAGLSPHSPYSTTPELLRLVAVEGRQRNCRLTTHVAESEQEFEMFMHRRGGLFEWLKTQRDMSDCGHGSPIEHLNRCGLLTENFLAVHVNYLWQRDAETLAQRNCSVVHCPSSHAYFRHRAFPREVLAAAGINLCLGTDSLASVSRVRAHPFELSLFDEMKLFSVNHPDLLHATIVQMATVNGARALGAASQLGEITENACADLIAIPFAGKISDAYAAVVEHSGDVTVSMIDGHWALPPKA